MAPSPSGCDLRVLRLNSLEIVLQPIPREERGRERGENHTGTYLHFDPWSTVYSRSHAACIKHALPVLTGTRILAKLLDRVLDSETTRYRRVVR